MSLRNRQKDELIQMLHFNGFFKSNEEDPVWKILVFDSHTQDIISPILKVSQLRNEGVTVFRSLSSIDESCSIPEVPVVFFVEATQENIKQICRILHEEIFEKVFLNWSGYVTKSNLEYLVEKCLQEPVCYDRICQVYDMFCDFTCLNDSLFTIAAPDAFDVFVNSSNVLAIDAEVERMAQSLFCVFATTGQVPVVRCRAGGGAVEMVARRLVELIREQLMMGKEGVFAAKETSPLLISRPLLILLERGEDLVTPLRHCWSYNSMLHDLFGIQQNRIFIEEKKQKFDLDYEEDFIWKRYSHLPTFEVASVIDQELSSYLIEKEKISRMTGSEDLSEDISEEKRSLLSTTGSLKEIMESIPVLTQKKRVLDLHTNFATNSIKQVGERKLDQYLLHEANASSSFDEKILLSLIGTEAPGNELDRLRFFLILALTNSAFMQDINNWKQILNLPKYDSFIDRILQLKSSQFVGSGPTSPTIQNPSKYSFQKSKIAGVLGSFVSGIKNLLPDSTDLPFTKIVECLLSVGGGSSLEKEFLYLDPKQTKPTDRLYIPDKEVFNNTYVFSIGGITYSEVNSLLQLCNKYPKLSITAGSTEVLNAKMFIDKFMHFA